MNSRNILEEVRDNIDTVIKQDSELGKVLWREFLTIHPADIARFFSDIDRQTFKQLFLNLPKTLKLEVFEELSDTMKVYALSFMSDQDRADALNVLPADELTDTFDLLSDEELKSYLSLLHRKARERVFSLMKFDPESAGGIMDTEVLTLTEDFTVEKSIKLLQRLRLSRDIYQQIYVTNRDYQLVGYIRLEDLVLQSPKTRISEFMRKNELVAQAQEDQEAIAKKMVHYGLMTVPVVGDNNQFLGVIPSETLVDIIVEEAGEDVQKMSALAPLKYPYFETSFFRFLYERSYILVALLLAQSFSTTIMRAYESTLQFGFLLYFTTMLISTGGNTSSQTSAIAIQGMASGEIRPSNMFRFLRREMLMALVLALILGVTSFIRAYLTAHNVLESFAISFSLSVIVLVSVIIGGCVPLLLKRLNIDPAFSAGPFLATLMDILGILIYCFITKLILF